MTLDELFTYLRRKHVNLWLEGDRLRYKGAKEVMTSDILEDLRNHKTEIITILKRADDYKESSLPEICTDLRSADNVPLSFAQESLWFLHQVQPENVSDHLYIGFRIKGPLQIDSLKKSLKEIVKRHEILRTTFPGVEGKPVQIIAPQLNLNFSEIDLSNLAGSETAAQAQRLVLAEARKPFEFESEQLLRVNLLVLRKGEYILLFTMHHMITDGFSFDVLFSELSVLYDVYTNDKPYPFEDLSLQYADYVCWQRQWMQGKALRTHISYWKQKLSGSSFVLELPADRPRPTSQSFQGARRYFSISKPLYLALQKLGQKEGCTMFMTLAAAFQLLLYKYTNQEDIIIGAPIANRKRPELEKLIGLFLNMIVLRTDLSGNPSFLELLGRVRQVTLEALAHQDLPFEKLVEALQPVRDLSRNPLFQVMMEVSPVENLELKIKGLDIEPLEIDNGTAQFDLSLHLYEGPNGLRGLYEYNTDLFDTGTIERFLAHFLTLLEGIAENPDRKLSDFSLLTAAERHQLFVEWNDTVMDYPRNKCIHELFEHQAKQTPDAIAIAYQNEQITYHGLNTRSNRLAHFLIELGVGPQVVVGLCTKGSIEMVIGLLGILKAGGIYLPLDPSYPEERLSFMLEDSRARILLAEKKAEYVLPKRDVQIVYLDFDDEIFARQSPEDPVNCVKAEMPAYLIYTSGSTGTPKGVIGLHRGTVNRFDWMWKTYPFEDGEVCCQKTSISFVDSIWEILGPLLQGIKSIIISDDVLKEPKRLISYLADEKITRIILVPSYLRVLLDTYPDLQSKLPQLKFWVSSGEILSKELCQRFYEKMPQSLLLNLYGSSEVSADVTYYDTNSMSPERRSVPIGRPIANTQVYILDRHLKPVPIGVPGELYIGGDGLAAGYLNLSQNTENAFISNPFSDKPDSRLYKTGDNGRWLADGNIEYIGRVDHQVKIRGFRIELGEVEVALKKHPDVEQCIVVAREDRPNDKRLVAYVVLRHKLTKATHELHRFLKQRLPDYMLPSAFVFLDTLPLTPSGKVDRKSLPVPDRVSSEPSEALVAPRDELELQLTKTWEKVLGVQPIGVNDNFFELGGHSLLAVRLVIQIEKILGESLPLAILFQAPTIKQLADILRELGCSAASLSLVTIEPDGDGFGSPRHKLFKRIPSKIRPYLREQYQKAQKQPGFLYFKQQYQKAQKQPGYLFFKREYLKARHSITRRFSSYRPSQLEKKLREIGLTDSDTVYMHSAFNAFNGFLGGPESVIDCILKIIGPSGNLVMVSMPYTGTAVDYFKTVKTFDVIKTESAMGIITEIFRRKKDVLRSLNPTHPILAFGPDAKWIVSDHEKTAYSCGKGSPFEKIFELNAKAFFFDTPFWKMTFYHFLEDKFKDHAPVKLYDDEPLEITVIDSNRDEIRVKTYVYSEKARANRRPILERELKNKNLIKTDKIGNTKLILANLSDVVTCAQELVNSGRHFYIH